MYCKGRIGLKLISCYIMMLLIFVVLLMVVVFLVLVSGIIGILDSKKLVFGMSVDFVLYEFYKVIDGKDEIVGFDIVIVKEIVVDLGVEFVIEDMGFDGLLFVLQSGCVDFVILGMILIEDCKKSIDFLDIYYKLK